MTNDHGVEPLHVGILQTRFKERLRASGWQFAILYGFYLVVAITRIGDADARMPLLLAIAASTMITIMMIVVDAPHAALGEGDRTVPYVWPNSNARPLRRTIQYGLYGMQMTVMFSSWKAGGEPRSWILDALTAGIVSTAIFAGLTEWRRRH